MLHIYKHEDDRRVLTEWIKDIPFKRAKIIEMKKKEVLGNHYHLKSDSVFYIHKGRGKYILRSIEPNSRNVTGWLFEGDCIFVPKGVIHTFTLLAGTIMLEAASEPYEKEDEIQVS
jgi:mannose-6-phosphate isomerase-like protein (cupin superfamily)